MNITFTEEKRGEIQRIQRQFRNQLSEAQIKQGTAQAINGVMQRSISKIKKEMKKEYNINSKYLSRIAIVSPKAKQNELYAGIRMRTAPIPIIGFKPKQSGSSISVTIKKGKTTIIRDSFITTMPAGNHKTKEYTSEHKGVYAHGKYDGKEFIYNKNLPKGSKLRAERSKKNDPKPFATTQLVTTDPFSMGTYKTVASEIQSFMGSEVVKRVEGILRSKVNKIAKK